MTRLVGTTDEVVSAFLRGEPKRTVQAPVPGGYRVTSVPRPDGETHLFSYNTVIAVRLRSGQVAVTPKKYSVTTSKLMSRLRRSLNIAQVGTVTVNARVPGRWGGFGPAWHPTGFDTLQFGVYEPL